MILTYDPWSDGATLSGGSWLASLPLANLQRGELAAVARTVSASPADSQLRVSFDRVRRLRTVLLGPTNLRPTYRCRIRASNDGFVSLAYDSGWLQPQSSPDPLALDWSEPEFWFGTIDHDDPERGLWLIHVLPQEVAAREWSIELDDAGNPAGYIEAGRLFLGRSWVPSTGIAVSGNGLSFEAASLSSTALSGARHFLRRKAARRFRFAFDHLPEAEAFDEAYRLMRVAGVDGQVFVLPEPDDAMHLQQRSFLGRLVQMDAISCAVWRIAGTGFEIEECI